MLLRRGKKISAKEQNRCWGWVGGSNLIAVFLERKIGQILRIGIMTIMTSSCVVPPSLCLISFSQIPCEYCSRFIEQAAEPGLLSDLPEIKQPGTGWVGTQTSWIPELHWVFPACCLDGRPRLTDGMWLSRAKLSRNQVIVGSSLPCGPDLSFLTCEMGIMMVTLAFHCWED